MMMKKVSDVSLGSRCVETDFYVCPSVKLSSSAHDQKGQVGGGWRRKGASRGLVLLSK